VFISNFCPVIFYCKGL